MITPEQYLKFRIYFGALSYTTASMAFTYPLDVVRIAMQANLEQSPQQVIKSYLNAPGFTRFYAGLVAKFYQQATKSAIRAFGMTSVPEYLEAYQLHPIYSHAIQSLVVGAFDGVGSIFWANVLIRRIHESNKAIDNTEKNLKKPSMIKDMQTMAQQHGMRRFFISTPINITSSGLSWFYFLTVYDAIHGLREKHNIPLIGLALLTAILPALLATPADAVAARQQEMASRYPSAPLATITARKIVSEFGFFGLLRGLLPRTGSKLGSTMIAYLVKDTYEKAQSQTRCVSSDEGPQARVSMKSSA